jgi:hypothetical protein
MFRHDRLCQLSMIDIQVTTKSEHNDHIALLYLEVRGCRYQSIIFVLFLYICCSTYLHRLLRYG